ncbi:MAG: tRNA (adenosine(37)-N6)-threonylcarbamoyltransferase complex transferase subunit TsaD [Paludibacteraceae bacterium]|nr:tRNA (adenosine(37)-N6)-threonylcarbamoyltransferase complex transferase subunit TsaD [Paludibacteraceae bacterium]MBQ2607587.1 tRNA (adenosine(37)-N6)-threonylcarbamoyltransferase complex transferase subunit TsaD [Paludibacteraceae bacterium]
MKTSVVILAIESSCDDTSAAVIRDGILLSNVIASQKVHEEFGGVVPELASRAHQLNIVPVVDAALRRAGVAREELSAIAFTRGPGLLGSLLVGTSFAKGLALSLGIPLIEVNHLQGHVLAHFVRPASPDGVQNTEYRQPELPFLCLLVSGGNSQIVLVRAYNDMQIIGQTIDDAAGEAFDKCAKVLGLPYPGGPWVDKLAKEGDPTKFHFARPNIPGYDYSFSGLKTSFLYTLRDLLREHGVETIDELAERIPNLREDLCAALQETVIDVLMRKLKKAAKDLNIRHVAVAGGVSANSGLRQAFLDYGKKYGWQVYIPPFSFTTDNAAMVCQAGYFKYLDHDFCAIDEVPYAKTRI